MRLRFHRQQQIDKFTAGFYCPEAGLAIEIDGDVHYGRFEYDDGREAEIEKYGKKVIRFTYNEIDIDIIKIEKIVRERISSPLCGI